MPKGASFLIWRTGVMGYTHYFAHFRANGSHDVRRRAVFQFFLDVLDIETRASSMYGVRVRVDFPRPFVVRIRGWSDDDGEPCIISFDDDETVFVKTWRRPHDVVVASALLRASVLFGDASVRLRSDGFWDTDAEWIRARRLYEGLFGVPPRPAGIESHPEEEDEPPLKVVKREGGIPVVKREDAPLGK